MKQISAVLTTSKECNSLKEKKNQIFQIEAHFGHAQGNLFLAKYVNRTYCQIQSLGNKNFLACERHSLAPCYIDPLKWQFCG